MKSSARHISVAVACALALAGCSSAGDGADAARPETSAAASPVTPGAGDPEPTAPDTASAAQETGAPDDTGDDAPSAPESSAADAPLEVLPPSPSQSGLPGLSPAPEPGKPLVTRPLPAGATGEGTLVRGYPSDVLPPVPDSSIETNSLSAHAKRLQVALTATTGRGAGAVLLFYRQQLTPLGFTEERVPAVAGAQAAAFRRGQNAVTVTVERVGDTSSYTLFSTLYAG